MLCGGGAQLAPVEFDSHKINFRFKDMKSYKALFIQQSMLKKIFSCFPESSLKKFKHFLYQG